MARYVHNIWKEFSQNIDRRGFLATLSAGFLSLLWGCNLPAAETADETAEETTNTSGNGETQNDDTPPENDGEDEPLEPTTCEQSAENIQGPFYRPDAPLRSDLTSDVIGTHVEVSGAVLDTACQPITNALIDVWQADNAGDYDNTSDAYILRGRLYADASGQYAFTTIHPGHYPNGGTYRPAHIHVKVSAEGYKDLTTQLYFAGDQYNDGDPFIVDSLIMDVIENAGTEQCLFNFVLEDAA